MKEKGKPIKNSPLHLLRSCLLRNCRNVPEIGGTVMSLAGIARSFIPPVLEYNNQL